MAEKDTKGSFVSVILMAYNQEEYISKTIDSILCQKTNCNYELVIGEDCSSDSTRDICIKYSQAFPDKICLLLNRKNIGMQQNFIQCLRLAKGKYIALCDGDDFWTDPQKLQMQYDLLENNSDFSGVHTKVAYIDSEDRIIGESSLMPKGKNSVSFDYLIQQNVIRTCSFMFQSAVLDNSFYKVLEVSPMPDYALFLATALKGDIYYLENITAAYRKHFGVTAKWKFSETKRWHLMIFSLFEKNYRLKNYRRSLYATKQYNYYYIFLKASDKGFKKGHQLILLFWYSILTLFFQPKIRVNKIDFKDIVKAVYYKKPKLRNFFK